MKTVSAKVLYYPKDEMFITLVNRHFFLGEYPELFRDNVNIEQIIGQVDESERWKAKDYALLDVRVTQSIEMEDARPEQVKAPVGDCVEEWRILEDAKIDGMIIGYLHEYIFNDVARGGKALVNTSLKELLKDFYITITRKP